MDGSFAATMDGYIDRLLALVSPVVDGTTTGLPTPGAGPSAPGLARAAGDSFWLPPAASGYAQGADGLFVTMLWMSAAAIALVVALLLIAVSRSTRRGAGPDPAAPNGCPRSVLWATRLGAPALGLAAMAIPFYLGASVFVDMRVAPPGALQIGVTAQKWSWQFTYPNGVKASDLHVPVDQPVRLLLHSADVLHSLFVPALRMKVDVIPGRDTTAWFEATEVGTYPLLCAEYCGSGHSRMLASVVVHTDVELERWLANEARARVGGSLAELGADLYRAQGCISCHSLDGRAGVGPTFEGAFGSTRRFAQGQPAVVDEEYLRESLLQPQAKLVAGFPPVMPPIADKLGDEDLEALVAYIKSLAGEQGATGESIR